MNPNHTYVRVDQSDNDIFSDPNVLNSKPTQPESRSWGGIFLTFLLNILSAIGFFFPLWTSFFEVEPQKEVLVLFWGKLNAVYKEPGLYYYNIIGRTLITMSVATQTLDIPKTTVVDLNGNPIQVAGIVSFKIVDSCRAAFDVKDVNTYLQRQAAVILKKMCSRYPYESKTGESLQHEPETVGREMVEYLQKKANICGVRIISFEINDLAYAPEIAQGMLVRQQATALLEARKVIVEGACSIVTEAVSKLAENGIKIDQNQQNRLVTTLLSVICSEAKVQPQFSISENVDSRQDELVMLLNNLNNTMMNRNMLNYNSTN